jgi:L-fuculose-phosphate aldolase
MSAERDRLSTERSAVHETAVAMAKHGLATGSSGNVSLRIKNGFLITASGVSYDRIRPEQVIETSMDGTPRSGEGSPSSEWRMHAEIYARRSDVRAIVHTHSIHATAAAIAVTSLPILHDEGKLFYGDSVPVSEHHPPGSWELARAVADALGEGPMVLISHHGAVGVGTSLDDALTVAVKLEEIAQLTLLARQFERFLSDEEEG